MRSTNYKNSLSLSQFLFLVFLVSLVIGVIITVVLVSQTRKDLYNGYQLKISDELDSRSKILSQVIATKRKEIEFINATPPIMGIVRATEHSGIDALDGTSITQWKTRLETIFKSYLSTHPDVMQARYIGVASEGRELVRVERDGGSINIRTDKALQSKATENYFKDIIQLAPGEVYFSDITLNREHGKIEFPYWPTYRVAEAVFREEGGIFGFVILNYDARPLINSVASNLDRKIQLYFMNSTGGYISHTNADKAFEFEFNSEVIWDNEFKKINHKSLGNFERITPTGKLENMVINKRQVAISDRDTGRHFSLAVGLSEDIILAEIARKRNYIITLLLAAFSVGFVFLAFYQNRINKTLVLLQNEAEFKAIFESSSDAIISISAESEILSWNNGAEAMFGYSSKVSVGNNIFELFLGNESDIFNQNTLHDVIHNGDIKKLELTAFTRSNNSIEISATLSPVYLESKNKIIGVAAIIRDITEQKITEAQILNLNISLEKRVQDRTQELEVARNQALQASTSKSEFIANVSHEIRTPMNGVLGMLHLLKKEQLNKKQTRLVNMAESSALALTGLINDILDVSKIEAGKLDIENRKFNLHRLFADISNSMSISAYEKGLELVFDLSAIAHEWVEGDANRVRQILVNLIGNAIKFTDSGEIYVIANTIENAESTISFACSVKDSGIGISEENQKRLFESFSQEDSSISRRFGGTGLGLTISRQLCERMGGKIDVYSEKLNGSTFSFNLTFKQIIGEKTVFDRSRLKPLNVLIISSDSSLSDTLKNQLLVWGVTNSRISSISELNSLNIGQVRTFDLTIVDQMLIDGLGVSLLDSLTKRTFGKTVLLRQPNISGDDEKQYSQSKPVLPLDLWNLLADLSGLQKTPLDFKPATTSIHSTDRKCKFAGKTILVVDDNQINLEVATGMLEDCGLIVATADSGFAAIELLKEMNQIDLIFLDCQMPEMDGYETARAIRSGKAGDNSRLISIVAMTANAMQGAREACLDSGMNDYMAKPLDLDVLEEKLSAHLKIEPKKDYIDKPEQDESAKVNVANVGVKVSERIYWDKDAALKRLRGREDRLKYLLELFLKNLPENCNELRSACQAALKPGNTENVHVGYREIKRITHKVKGVAGNISAIELFSLCEELEKSAEAEDKKALASSYSELDPTLLAMTNLMQNYLLHHDQGRCD